MAVHLGVHCIFFQTSIQAVKWSFNYSSSFQMALEELLSKQTLSFLLATSQKQIKY